MSAPSDPLPVMGYFDGATGARRRPMLMRDGDGFTLRLEERTDGPFAFADLVAQGAHDGSVQFAHRDRPGWRIDLSPAIAATLADVLPREGRYGGFLDRTGLWVGAAACAGIAALVILGIARVPALAARLVPVAVEAQIGDAMVGDFGNRTCNAPAGDAALGVLLTRLGPAADGAKVRVVNVPMVNAVTLPGGHVLIFDGLLRRARSADEVAGVLAHELGHVANRDVLAGLIRQLGLSVVLGGLDGNVGGWTNSLLAAGYSRNAERAADGYAIDLLARARIAPDATAAFFGRLGASEPRSVGARIALGYVASHPLSQDRRKRFADSGRGRTGDTPALNATEWTALKRICTDDKDVARTEFRM